MNNMTFEEEQDLDDSTSNSSFVQPNFNYNNGSVFKQKMSEDFVNKKKTELCRSWEMGKPCKYGESVFIIFSNC